MLRSLLLVAATATVLQAQRIPSVPASDPKACPSCETWNKEHVPSRLFGNVYYVGPDGLSSVLLTSPGGHILVDGGLPESASVIASHIEALGFNLRDVRVILNSHAHFDHAGGIALLQKLTGARVLASPESAPVLRTGKDPVSDPQHGLVMDFGPASNVDEVHDGDTIRVGDLALAMHATAGHMPGGTSWSWRSCEDGTCLDFIYADSQTPISNGTFLYSRNATYPTALADFEKGLSYLEHASCDVLITAHPGASSLFSRMAKGREGLVDKNACRRYASDARRALADRLAREKGH